MSTPFTSVVSLHTNPRTCGVAKFGRELAQRLRVPFCGLEGDWGRSPLLSLKWSELTDSYDVAFIRARCLIKTYGLFWHDAGDQAVIDNLASRAQHVFYADPSLGSPGLWCPSLLTARKRPVRLFSWGMAHKLQPDRYRRVRELLADHPFHLRVSVGLHEGTTLDGAEKHFDQLKDILGPENVTILGLLSDDAVAEELQNADTVLAFFEQGVRANNTTVHAALDAGKRVITNHDANTPAPFRMATLDVNALTAWPAANRSAVAAYSWDNLIKEMERLCVRSASAAV